MIEEAGLRLDVFPERAVVIHVLERNEVGEDADPVV
jgi:hypothetical protein